MTDATPIPRGIRSEIVTGGVAAAAILLFVATGSRFTASVIGLGDPVQRVAFCAVLLNIALLLFAWSRHREASAEAAARVQADARTRLLSTRDHLTGLHTRGAFIDHVRTMRGPVTVAVVDLDRFGPVNEQNGHAAGDALLRAAGDRLRAANPACCGRLGADEFCLAWPAGGEPDRGDALVRALAAPFGDIHVTASAGFATGGDAESLLRQAHLAMRAAKDAGGNRARLFHPEMESALKRRSEIEAGMRRGIPKGEFLPSFQPQVDLATGRLHGFEALARWQRPDGETAGPDTFIPAAEETGLIGDLFDVIFRQALDAARAWPAHLILSVNISPGQFADPWLASKLLKTLTASGFPARRLEVEITESSLFENLPLAQDIVASFKRQGIALALDDFGTGYSSLAHLNALPFDRIKIDGSFVRSMDQAESLAVVKAIAKLGESLAVPVTAEGVEDAGVASRLLSLGCATGQGWHFGRPLPAAEAEALIARMEAETRVTGLRSAG